MSTLKCPNCNHEILEDLSRCPFCDYSRNHGESPPPTPRQEEGTEVMLTDADPPPPEGETDAFRFPDTVVLPPGEEQDRTDLPSGHPPPSRRAERAPGRAPLRGLWGIGGALFALSLLLFWLAWSIMRDTPESLPPDQEAALPAVPLDSGWEPPQQDGSWEEHESEWRQVMKQSELLLEKARSSPSSGTPPPVMGKSSAARGVAPQQTQQTMEIKALDPSLKAGDSIDIVWQSADGRVWRKLIGHPFELTGASRHMARILVTPQESAMISAARAKGQVFAVPR